MILRRDLQKATARAHLEALARDARVAEGRIRPHVRETPLEDSPWLSIAGDARVLLKLENLQHTGSFKVRGAINELLSLPAEERERGAVAASTGNHGAAVAYGLERLGSSGIVFVPESASPSKVRAIEARGVEIRRVAGDPVMAEEKARAHAAERDLPYISPYNSPRIVAGQGTVGVELTHQLAGAREIDAVFVALGGGGLISGIAAVLKASNPEIEIVGCSPANSAMMIESIRAGRIVDLPSLPTLSDGTAGGVEAGAITFPLCRELVDAYVTVGEDEIGDALRRFVDTHHLLIEGAAAVAVAAYLKTSKRYLGRRVVIVICGGNIGVDTLKTIL